MVDRLSLRMEVDVIDAAKQWAVASKKTFTNQFCPGHDMCFATIGRSLMVTVTYVPAVQIHHCLLEA